MPEFVRQPGTSCAALLHNLGSYPAQLRQQCCTGYAAMLHKFGNNAAKVWQQCCARAKACILEGWSMCLRVQKHASESVKALVLGCERMHPGVGEDCFCPYRECFSYDKRTQGDALGSFCHKRTTPYRGTSNTPTPSDASFRTPESMLSHP